MKEPEPFRMPYECWIILLPGFVAGVCAGGGIAKWLQTIEQGPGLLVSSAFAVSAIVLVRSLLVEAVSLLDPDKKDFGYDSTSFPTRLALIQAPMFVAGAVLAFSAVLAVAHMSADVRVATLLSIGAFLSAARFVDMDREAQVTAGGLSVVMAVLAVAFMTTLAINGMIGNGEIVPLVPEFLIPEAW